MLLLIVEEGVGDGQLVIRAKFQESLTVLILLPNTMMSNAGWPGLKISTYACVQVSQYEETFLAGNSSDNSIQGLIELVLDVG